MCWKCDHPDATDEDYFELIRGVIDSRGWFVQGVEKDRWRPGFAYTVGLTELGHPELLVTGMKFPDATHLLGAVAHPLACHHAPEPVAGHHHVVPDGPMLEFVDVAEPTVHLVMADGMYGPGVRAVQLVYVDDRGHWPWQPGFRGHQSVLGPRAERRADQ
jgi:hypothetical protein